MLLSLDKALDRRKSIPQNANANPPQRLRGVIPTATVRVNMRTKLIALGMSVVDANRLLVANKTQDELAKAIREWQLTLR